MASAGWAFALAQNDVGPAYESSSIYGKMAGLPGGRGKTLLRESADRGSETESDRKIGQTHPSGVSLCFTGGQSVFIYRIRFEKEHAPFSNV